VFPASRTPQGADQLVTAAPFRPVVHLWKANVSLNLSPKIPSCWDSLRAPCLLCSSLKLTLTCACNSGSECETVYGSDRRQSPEPTRTHCPCCSWVDSDACRHSRFVSSDPAGCSSSRCGCPHAEPSNRVAATSRKVSSEVPRSESRLYTVFRSARR
jgi:hypothetical protein